MKTAACLVGIFTCWSHCATAAELEILHDGRSDYQIVVPDKSPSESLASGLHQTARLLQTTLQANGADIPIVPESQRDAGKPAIFLGDTAFARRNGVDPTTLEDWSYVQRAIGRDVIIAGNDHPPRAPTDNDRRPNWDRVGTAKGVADFLREFAGVRFLYPDVPTYTPVRGAEKIDLRNSPAIEFLPKSTITVPAELNVRKTPLLRLNTAHPAGGGFYDLANNRFPRVDEMFGGHTWERAVPPEQHFESHPEYFALLSGSRQKPEGGRAQYCLSNPDVQQLIYRDLAARLDAGYLSVDLGQPDGFRECQCEECAKLYGTGNDWSEKIWLFNRRIAERLQSSHPGRQVTMMSYILTAKPPKSFQAFPANTSIMLTGTNEVDIAPWREHVVPRGFTGYVYNWCPNLTSRYTPMRTPRYIETQVKRLAANQIRALLRDGAGQLFGLEGPVYYVMGRMFDDPEHNTAQELTAEFCQAAFGPAAPAMSSFYDQLYHAINLYSDHIGTRCDAWSYESSDGRRRKTVSDPFQLLGFLYPPNLLAALESDLSQAERLAVDPKVKTRLALVRTEFDYLRHLMNVVHLKHAYEIHPDRGSRDRLLDAIDARNVALEALYAKKPNPSSGDWAYVLFPFPGHSLPHLRLAHDGYQEPFANTCLNWDTRAMRAAPSPEKKRLTVVATDAPLTLDDARWETFAAHDLTLLPPLNNLPRKSTLRLAYDRDHLYVRIDCELEPDAAAKFPAVPRDRLLEDQESVDVYVAPQNARGAAFRFRVGPNEASKYDAVAGRITDAMDPRHNRDDPTWNGEWSYASRVDDVSHRWHGLITIPFATLESGAAAPGAVWRANFYRRHLLPRSRFDRSIWSSTLGNGDINDRSLFGEVLFE